MIKIIENTKDRVLFEKTDRNESWFNNDCSDENLKKQCGREKDNIERVQFLDGKFIGSELMVYFSAIPLKETRVQEGKEDAATKWLSEHRKKRPGNAEYLTGCLDGYRAAYEELIQAVKKYGRHLPECNLNANWLEADQAMADTPIEFRDDGYWEALHEIEEKKKRCTCGLNDIANYLK